jgi:Transmembrane amino acid transporter protein
MLAETISLGILSLPWAMAQVGGMASYVSFDALTRLMCISGMTLIVGLGLVALYNGKVYGDFKLAHPEITNMASAGRVLFKKHPKFGQYLFSASETCVLLFVMAAHVVSFKIMMAVLLSPRQFCNIYWSLLGAFVQFIFGLPRTMRHTAYISVLSTVSVLVAVIMVIADVAHRYNDPDVEADLVPPSAGFASAFTGVLNIILAYAGHVAYFTLSTELRITTHFKYALYLQMIFAIALYAIAGGVIYYFVGPTVQSPALKSASPSIAKASFGVASFTIVVAGVVNGHVAAKHVYHGLFKQYMAKNNAKSYFIWTVINFIGWALAWLLAELIPSFPHILAIIGCVFTSWFSCECAHLATYTG